MYIGNKQIKDNQIDRKLVTGEDLVDIVYNDGSKDTLTRRMFEQVVSDVTSDPTTLRDARIFPVAAKILELCLNWGIKVDEMDYLLGVLTRSINANLQQADDKLWGKGRNELTLIDLDSKLRNMDENKEVETQQPVETAPEQPEKEETVEKEGE